MVHVEGAQLLFEARRGKTYVDEFPEAMRPRNTDEAYAIQRQVADLSGPIKGWKVVVPSADEIPKAASVPINRCIDSGSEWRSTCTARIEIEVAFRLECDLPARASQYTEKEVLAVASSQHIAIEVLESRFRDKRKASEMSNLADSLGNGAIVIGDEIEIRSDDNADGPVLTLFVDNVEQPNVSRTMPIGKIISALTWLSNHAMAYGGLKRGQTVLTGARIGPVEVGIGSHVVAKTKRGEQVSLIVRGLDES